jgi:hypothetical protein
MKPTDHELALAMERHGGNFARKLALAYMAADEDNRRKLAEAFRDLFDSYTAALPKEAA